MKALRIADSVQPPSLVLDDIAQPRPGRGELLIQVYAAGVIPTELGWDPTHYTRTGEARTHAVPGHEFSGVVAGMGEGAGAAEIGLEVYGMNDWYSDGAMAEYCVAPWSSVAPKPRSLTHVQAASIPISALTAWQGLFDRAHLKSGERVLVHGGAGGVGTFAIQFARMHGAHVIATASAQNRDFVMSLGADQVIDYRTSRFEQHVKEIDVVFDTVGGETLERSWSILKPSGRMITIVSAIEHSGDTRAKQAFFIVEPNQKQLVDIAQLLDAGKLQPVVDSVVPLSQGPDVFAGRVPKHGRGKLVIEVRTTNQEERKTNVTGHKSIKN